MSLCLAANTVNCVIIAGDGRLLRGKNIISNSHRKVRPLNHRAILYASGMQDIADLVRKEVINSIDENSSFENICSTIQPICQKYHNANKKFIVPDLLETVVSCVLAYYDDHPRFAGFAHNDNFNPYIFDKPNSAWVKGAGDQEKILKYFAFICKNNSSNRSIEDLIFETYKYANSNTFTIGGMVTVYSLNSDGIKILRKDEIG